ncbi:DNA replication complex GINS protein PSF1 [Phascolomyces articulosus]|uniref:DNA replication complex GINS protein PSF1 n=1 Tax=Phascolomyces articulosus TaxID=60185 RepID=A0AAD5JPG9_9FUNG|nr:DNA replication complex GINS protein PSF1 [Phascolomyces articulosus]
MTTMMGESSYKLAKEAKRTSEMLISTYNDDLVQNVCREIRMLHARAEASVREMRNSDTAPPNVPSQLTQIMLHHLTIKRNKRILFAYHHQRLGKLKELSWGVGRQSQERKIKESLSKEENDFLESYGDLVNDYKSHFLDIDLGGNGGVGLDPPLDLFIEVRVLRDAGKIITEYGELNLTKGNQEFVRRSDVETLIKAGYLKHIA